MSIKLNIYLLIWSLPNLSFQQPSWTMRAHVVCQFTDGVYIVNRTLPRSLHDVGSDRFYPVARQHFPTISTNSYLTSYLDQFSL